MIIRPKLEAYLHDHTTPESPLLDRLREETHAKLSDPGMQVGRVEGTFLRQLVALCDVREILEIGTFSGYSALSMAAALPEDGRLVTLDIDPEATAMARRYFEESREGSRIELRLGAALDSIAALASEGRRFDLVFIDADKENYPNYWDAVLPLVRDGGVILADNTLWGGKVLDPQEESDRGIVAFNAKVREDPRVEQVLLSVRDGLMLCRKLPAS